MPNQDRKMLVEITAKDRTKKAVSSARQSLNSLAKGVGIVGTAVGGLGLSLMVKQTLELNDALAKTADQLGLSTRALSGFQLAAQLGGLNINQMNTSIGLMNRNIADASEGVGLAVDSIKKLGLEAVELKQQGPEQTFIDIVERLNEVENASERTSIAMDLFGRSGGQILSITADSLREAKDEAEALGIAISRADSAKIEAANDAMLRMGSAIQGVVNTLTVELAPILGAVGTEFANLVKENRGFKDEIIAGLEAVLTGVGWVGNAFHGWELIFRSLKVAWLAETDFIIGGFEAVDGVITESINMAIRQINFLIEQVNKIPGVGVPLISEVSRSETLAGIAEESRRQLQAAAAELGALAREEMPSDKIRNWLNEIKEAATIAGQEIEANAISRLQAGIGGATGQEDGGQDEKVRQSLQKRLDILLESQLTEREMLEVDYEQKQMLLDSALNQRLIAEQDYINATTELNRTFQDGLTTLEEEASQARLQQLENERNAKLQTAQNISGALNTISQITTSNTDKQSRKDFEINKAANVGQAVMNTYTGATKALAQGGFWGYAQAALIIAYGLSQVSKIKSQQYNSGSAGGGAGGGAGAGGEIGTFPTTPTAVPDLTTQQDQQPQAGVTLIIEGNLIGQDEWVEDNLIPLLQDFDGRGVTVTTEE